MKACVSAGIILLLLFLLVAVNALYVRQVVHELRTAVLSLPDISATEPGSFPNQRLLDEITQIKAYLSRHEKCISLSVGYALFDRVQESLLLLAAYAEASDGQQYAATRATLLDQIADMGRLERFSMTNIF